MCDKQTKTPTPGSVQPAGSERLGASGGVWTATGERVDADGVKVIMATHSNGYPSEFPWWDWQTMPPNTELSSERAAEPQPQTGADARHPLE